MRPYGDETLLLAFVESETHTTQSVDVHLTWEAMAYVVIHTTTNFSLSMPSRRTCPCTVPAADRLNPGQVQHTPEPTLDSQDYESMTSQKNDVRLLTELVRDRVCAELCVALGL